MNREIKFRAFDIESNKYVTGEHIMSYVKGQTISFAGVSIDSDTEEINENVILEQFTGLKDKNGVDIYEGDIVASNHTIYDGFESNINQVDFKCGCWRLCNNKAADIPLFNYKPMYLEVIGNIHQNPELI